MCVAANGEQAGPGKRIVSTSNRNFIGRQGPGARTHLASPAMAAAALRWRARSPTSGGCEMEPFTTLTGRAAPLLLATSTRT